MNPFKFIMSVPKTIYINFKCFNIRDAIKLPITCGYNVILKEIHKGCFEFDEPIKRNMCSIGMNEGSFRMGAGRKSYLNISGGGEKLG